ncbi:hypothetical protein [Nocardioides bigeumensis]|jgi:hypothetical protein|uniref:Uncharacterized protein n=1 Tax=Nocardioides bigeumensis TaxID=433657 RepID=A0ABN2XXQ4_9ACTN
MSEQEVTTKSGKHGHTAGIYDIRNIIGGLMGVYGVVLTLMGLFGDQEGDKTGDVNANLWAGLALLVFGISMIAWAQIKPVVVPEDFEADDDEDRPAGH